MFLDIVIYANNFETKEKIMKINWSEKMNWYRSSSSALDNNMWSVLPLIVAKCLEQDLNTNDIMLSLSHNK